jgi:hypothetical protein
VECPKAYVSLNDGSKITFTLSDRRIYEDGSMANWGKCPDEGCGF